MKMADITDADGNVAEPAEFVALSAYNILNPNERVIIEDHEDPALRHVIRFLGGVAWIQNQAEYDVLAQKAGVYFEDLPAGEAAPVCKKCRFAPRSHRAYQAHMERVHLD